MELMNMPTEVVERILAHLERAQVAKVARTCRYMSQRVQRRLFFDPVIELGDMRKSDGRQRGLNAERFIELVSTTPGAAVRDLTISANPKMYSELATLARTLLALPTHCPKLCNLTLLLWEDPGGPIDTTVAHAVARLPQLRSLVIAEDEMIRGRRVRGGRSWTYDLAKGVLEQDGTQLRELYIEQDVSESGVIEKELGLVKLALLGARFRCPTSGRPENAGLAASSFTRSLISRSASLEELILCGTVIESHLGEYVHLMTPSLRILELQSMTPGERVPQLHRLLSLAVLRFRHGGMPHISTLPQSLRCIEAHNVRYPHRSLLDVLSRAVSVKRIKLSQCDRDGYSPRQLRQSCASSHIELIDTWYAHVAAIR